MIELRELIPFLIGVVVASLSGVLMPGPVTAATVAAGARQRHAGALIAIGHGIVEFPLMILIVVSISTWRFFERPGAKTGIGLVGGVFFVVIAVQMLLSLRRSLDVAARLDSRSPLLTGVILTCGNPYFFVWWLGVGLPLATKAGDLGAMAFALFTIVHWSCDLIWLEALSLASHKGATLLGERGLKIIIAICAVTLLVFGVRFMYDAATTLMP